jgi:hypothetical protein
MKQFDIKKEFNNYGWNTGFKFHIKWSNTGVAKVFITDRPTKYKAGGYGYCKESSVLATMINDLIGEQPYNPEIYGNSGNYYKDKNLHHLSGGVGFDSIQNSFQSLKGAKLNRIYWGTDFNVYEITFPNNI